MNRHQPPIRLDDAPSSQGLQCIQDRADLGRLLVPFELRQEALAQVAEPGERFQRQAPVLAIGEGQSDRVS